MDSAFVRDVVERDTAGPNHSDSLEFSSPTTGFPAGKRRFKHSTFKQQQQAKTASSIATLPNQGSKDAQPDRAFGTEERRKIDQENRQRIGHMTSEEIAAAQRELMQGLSPSLIQKLLQRARIDEPDGPSPFDAPTASQGSALPPPEIIVSEASGVSKQPISKGPQPQPFDEDQAPPQPPADLFPITDQPDRTHFPAGASVPDLNPSDPDFLSNLHRKYFPDLPADPSKLAWMAPIPTEDSPADRESPYYPDQSSIAASALRFDFRGVLIPPRLSRSIPVLNGLHHHGEAPEAAGYTVGELAILARSAVPAQRCIAFQTLGRILFRLGKGDWGSDANDPLAMGIWASVREGRILDSLTEASMDENGHRSSRSYAIEALWLFEKGGWKEKCTAR